MLKITRISGDLATSCSGTSALVVLVSACMFGEQYSARIKSHVVIGDFHNGMFDTGCHPSMYLLYGILSKIAQG